MQRFSDLDIGTEFRIEQRTNKLDLMTGRRGYWAHENLLLPSNFNISPKQLRKKIPEM